MPIARRKSLKSHFVLALATAMIGVAFVSVASAQGGPPPAVRSAIQSVERMLVASDDASLQAFIADRLAPAYRAKFTADSLLGHLRMLRQQVGGRINDVAVERTDEGLRLQLGGAKDVVLLLALDDDARLTRLDLDQKPVAPPSALEAVFATITWDSMASTFARAESLGFGGVVVARHDGREVLRHAYGIADKLSGRRNAMETVYGIGSTPIDFTVTGISLLGQRGRLALSDSIGKYLRGVPADKRGMTLQHLMSGRSGLPNFHHIETVDWDADLAWVDRETAVRRILAQPLLFTPGAGDEHSHSAYGLLAAVIEIVSGQSYREFVRTEIFKPVGMTRTGFYGDALGLATGDFATGYGASSVGVPNIPPNWGPTSWLVMGSGGMYSTLADMERYYAALEAGTLLTGTWAKRQQGSVVDVGGSDRGFFIFRATNGRGTQVLLLMNGEGRSSASRALTKELARLVR